MSERAPPGDSLPTFRIYERVTLTFVEDVQAPTMADAILDLLTRIRAMRVGDIDPRFVTWETADLRRPDAT